MSNYDEFLKGLTELTKKHGIYIYGCGCCGSPSLTETEPKRCDGDLIWDSDKKEYSAW